MKQTLCCIVVFYYPSDSACKFYVNYSQKLNITPVIIVDNTPSDDINYSIPSKLTYISLKENKGIAYAQNEGIRKAKELGFQNIVFFDQDSVWDENYLAQISCEFGDLQVFDPNAVILGPILINKLTNTLYKQELKSLRWNITSNLISSGSIVSISSFDEIGLMDKDLFIDYVDFEWCWRAKYRGYNIYKSGFIKLVHQVGNRSLNFVGFSFVESTPFRYYYSYKNYLTLLKRKYVPLKWKIKTGIKNLITLLLIPFLCKGKSLNTYKHIFNGIVDGIKSKNCNEKTVSIY